MDTPDPTLFSCPYCTAQMPQAAGFCPGCGRPVQSALHAHARVGALAENIAGAIAYLTFILAVVFLLRPPYRQNRFVRFHSVQCLLFWLTCVSIAAAFRLAVLVLILIPTLGPLLITLLAVIGVLAAIVIWAVLVVKAFQGETFELPVLGELADRYADPI